MQPQKAISTTINYDRNGLVSGMWQIDVNDLRDVENAKYYGAIGDGVANDAPAINRAIQALSAAGGGHLFFPAGTYLINTSITAASNVSLVGAKNATIVGAASVSSLVYGSGTYGTEIPLTVAATRGDTTITAQHDYAYSASDWVLVKSVTNALSVDAGKWQLGQPTAGWTANYFAEAKQVVALGSNTSLTLSDALFFPLYGITALPNSGSRTTSTVAKITWLQNFHIRGIKLRSLASSVNLCDLRWAKDCTVDDCTFEMASAAGPAVHLRSCYASRVARCTFTRNINTATGASHNAVVLRGCFSCECVGNTDYYSYQAFDVSWDEAAHPSLHCRISGNTSVGSAENMATCHSGCYGISFVDNIGAGLVRGGIRVRSPGCVIQGNQIRSGQRTQGAGIQLYDGYAYDSVCSGNNVTGFSFGVHVRRDNNPAGPSTGSILQQNIVIANNVFRQNTTAVYLQGGSYTTALSSDISILANQITDFVTNGIVVDSYYNGVAVRDNYISGDGTQSQGIRISTNCADCDVSQNTLDGLGAGATGIFMGAVNDFVTFTDANSRNLGLNRNRMIGTIGTPYSPAVSPVGSATGFGATQVGITNFTGAAMSVTATIADDARIFVPIGTTYGTVTVSSATAAANGIASIIGAVSATKYAGHANFACVATTLTGTTGVDGNFTVGYSSNQIVLENRTGASVTVKFAVIG